MSSRGVKRPTRDRTFVIPDVSFIATRLECRQALGAGIRSAPRYMSESKLKALDLT